VGGFELKNRYFGGDGVVGREAGGNVIYIFNNKDLRR